MAHDRAETEGAGVRYGVHPAVLMVQKWAASLKQKTGRDVYEWVDFARAQGPSDAKERVAWLKQEHGLGTIAATWLAERADGRGDDYGDPEAYLRLAPGMVDLLFAGKRAGLRPIYDALLTIAMGLGADVRACPGKTMVSLYRRHVFADLKPTTLTRIDLGLALGDRAPERRLIDTGGLRRKDRITHRIPLARPEEIDDEVREWMRFAYNLDH